MAKAKQLSLLKDPRINTKLWWIVKQSTYGGSLNYRKVKRPFDSKKLTHAVFKARLGKANGFARQQQAVREILLNTAKKYGVRIKDLAIHHDHLHVLFYTKLRESQVCFLRLAAAELGRKFKAAKDHLGRTDGSLWAHRPFTRLVGWGRKSLDRVRRYIERNRNEVLGFIHYTPRKHKLTAFLTEWEKQTLGSA
jgi:REP element-mobilizing transposase RayT